MSAKARSLSKGHHKVHISWSEYTSLIDQLIQKIVESKISFSCVYGPARGGVIPAVIISHAMNKNYLDEIGFHNNFGNKKILIVDDIIDSADTMERLSKHCKIWKTHHWTASIFKHKNSPFTPDFYIKENNDWIVFPYEKE